MPVNTISIFTRWKERYKSLSLWKYKELPIRTTTSITFPLLNEKNFYFWQYIIHYKPPNMTTHAKDTILISKVTVTSLPSLFDRLQTACFIDLQEFQIKLRKTCFLYLRYIMTIRHTGNTYSKNSSTSVTRYSESASDRMSARASVVIWQLERVSVGRN